MPRLVHIYLWPVLASAVLTASACAGGEDAPELTADSAAAVALVEAACAQWNDAVESRGDFPVRNFDPERPARDDLPAVGDYFAQGHAARDEMISTIGAIDVPDEIETRFEALLAALRRGQEVAKRQASAAQAGDVDGFTATLDEADASRRAIEETAGALGATECAA